MRWISAVIACTVLATLVVGGGAGAQGGKVVVYSALDTPVTNAVLQAFEQTSGLRTEALTLAAAGTLPPGSAWRRRGRRRISSWADPLTSTLRSPTIGCRTPTSPRPSLPPSLPPDSSIPAGSG